MAHSKMSPKRKVNVRGQKHSLAYINDKEKRLLRKHGGSGKPGPSGVPTYFMSEGMGVDDGGSSFGDMPDDNTDTFSDGMDESGMGEGQSSVTPDTYSSSGGKNTGGSGVGRQDGPGGSQEEQGYKSSGSITGPDAASLYTDKQKNKLADDVAARKDPFTGIMKYSVIGTALNAVSKFTRGRIEKGLREGGTPVFDKQNNLAGVMTPGIFGGMVYTGRSLDKDNYDGPFTNQVVFDPGESGNDAPNVRSGAKENKPVEIVDGKLPDAPKSGEGGDATEDAKRRSKMGKESTISTTAQGLLGKAKTRNRSLMSGLIS